MNQPQLVAPDRIATFTRALGRTASASRVVVVTQCAVCHRKSPQDADKCLAVERHAVREVGWDADGREVAESPQVLRTVWRTCEACVADEHRARWARSADIARSRIPVDARDIDKHHAVFEGEPGRHRVEARKKAAKAISTNASRGGLGLSVVVLSGDKGAGKTSVLAALAAGIASRATESEKMARRADGLRWFAASDIANARRETKLGLEPETLRLARNASVLIVDELGSEDDRTQDLRHVLFHRFEKRLITLLGTYLSLEQVQNRYDAGLVRRLFEDRMAECITIATHWVPGTVA